MKQLESHQLSLVGTTSEPFRVDLMFEDESVPREFVCSDVLRALVGRRLVVSSMLDDEPVILKLFLGTDRRRYFARERRGLDLLRRTLLELD